MVLIRNLITYFQDCGIQIDLRPSYRKSSYPIFGYKLYGGNITIQQEAIFGNPERAIFDALTFAFRIWERELVRAEYKSRYHPKMHRPKQRLRPIPPIFISKKNDDKISNPPRIFPCMNSCF